MQRDAESGRWRLTRFDDVATALADPAFSSARLPPAVSAPGGAPPGAEPGDAELVARALAAQALFLDPPEHTRVRRALRVVFDRSRSSGLRAELERDARRLARAVGARPSFEFMEEFAGPLASGAIARLLGFGDPDTTRAWATALGRFHDGAPDATAGAARVFRGLAAAMREHPLSTGEALTPSEAAANAALVVFAGQPTTAYLLGSAVLVSMRWPGVDPRRLVEETLRLDSPIQGTTRRVRHTVAIGGHVLCSGDVVELWLGAANRDPARYEQPAKMQIGRRSGHLAFGAGPHACPGAALAHLTTAVGLDALARQGRLLPNGAPMWYPNASVRGLTRLPVRWSDAA